MTDTSHVHDMQDTTTQYLLVILLVVSIALIFFVDIFTPLTLTIWILYFIPLFLTLYLRWRRGPFVVASIIIALTYLGYFIPVQVILNPIDLINRIFFTFLTVVIAILIDYYKQSVESLNISDARLRLANKKLGLLSAITRHDILNQIQVIRGYLAILEEKIKDPDLVEYIGRSETASRTIEHYLAYTRDYQDMGVNTPTWQNIRTVVARAKGALDTGKILITTEGPDMEVFADQLFEKVFLNLIDDSIQHGGKKLHTIRIALKENKQGLCILYEDDGIGIEEIDHTHLFERGFGKHTGLGLFLSREILSITGITILENGVPGNGVRFEMAVPHDVYRPGGRT